MKTLACFLVLSGLALLVVAGRLGSDHEVVRLRAHFDSVDVELRLANVPGLDAGRTASRRRLTDWLRDYRNAGSFPVNDRFAHAMPFFRDSRGVLCAMAYLIARSGRVDLVDRIASDRNNAFIAELAGDRDLTRWLDSVGLSATEAARIQPAYGESTSQGGTGFAVGSIILVGGSLVASGFNIFSPTKASGWLGIAAGVGAGILGAAHITETGANEAVAVTDVLIGVTSVALGIRGIVVGGRGDNATAAGSGRGKGIELGMAPLIRPSGNQAGFGLMLQARF